ncbi:MAG: ABC transporter permease [Lachnospiraceae bacterium]|nr:ABC transporter permease [Lachnospiraceae bacterium]
MRKVWLLLRAEAAGWKNRWNMVGMLVLIVVIIGTFSYIREQREPESGTGKMILGVANEDTSEYAGLLLDYFKENEVFQQYVELVEESERKLEEALWRGELDGYLAIPKSFAQSMIDMEHLPVRAVISMKNPTKALVLRHVMDAYENYIEAVEVNCTALYRLMKEEGYPADERNAANMEVSLELIFTALGKDELFRYRELEAKEELSLSDHYKYTAVYFVLLFSFLPAGLRLLALKKSGLTRRLKSMNTSGLHVAAAAGLPYLLLCGGVFFALCWQEEKLALYPEGLLLVLPWLVAVLVLGWLCDSSQTYLFVCSLMLVGLLVLGGLIPEQFLPEQFETVAEWMPNRRFVQLMAGLLEVQ